MADQEPRLTTAADLRARIQASTARIQQVQARAEHARQQLAEQRTTATSPDHAVTVTVDAAGTLLDLHFAATASKLASAALAHTVLRTYRQATAEAVGRTQQLIREVAGEHSPVLDAIRATVQADGT